jgi:hypothetical protein
MGDDDARPTLHSSVQRLLNNFLALFVKCARCFIKDHDLGRFNESSGNRNPLFLATRKLAALQPTNFIKSGIQDTLKVGHNIHVHKLLEPLLVVLLDTCSISLQEGAKVTLATHKQILFNYLQVKLALKFRQRIQNALLGLPGQRLFTDELLNRLLLLNVV